jgi:hypothetical protein
MDNGLSNGLRSHFMAHEARDQKWTPTTKVVDPNDEILKDQETVRPDVTYMPRKENFEARTKRLAAKRNGQKPNVPLPQGFPSKIEGARVWSALEGLRCEEMLVHLTKEEITEAEHALTHFKGECWVWSPFVVGIAD